MQQSEEKNHIIENYTDTLEITEEYLHAVYLYLAMHFEEMTDREKLYWNYVLSKIDPEYDKEK